MDKKNAISIAAVLAVGLLLGAAILRSGGHDAAEAPHDHDHAAEPRPAASAAEPRTRFSDEQLRHNGITLAAAGPARLAVAVQLLGDVKLNQDRAVHVTPRLAGIVEAVHVNAGD